MKNLFYLLPLLFTTPSFGQQNCNCEEVLTNLVLRVEKDYPGFAEKTKDTLVYNSLKKELFIKAKKTANDQCLTLLTQYASFFKDGHIWILPNEQDQSPVINKKAVPKELDVDITEFKETIKLSKDKLEGIWTTENYTIGIKKTGENQYTGFVIETKNQDWKPKEIKFQLDGKENIVYYLSDHSAFKDTFKVYENYLLYINNLKFTFLKQDVNRKLDSVAVKNKIDELDGFFFKKLSDKSSLIKISSFNYPYVGRIEKLIADHKSIIETSENLIIDIRNNGGGTDNAYKVLLPLIATNPIRNVGIELLSTQGLIDGVTKYKDGLIEKDKEKNKIEIEELENRISTYKSNFGKFINSNSEIVSIDSVQVSTKSPKQIIILVNNKVGSAAENFLLKAKQSKKVKILGTPTSGVLDYANAYFFKFGCDNYRLLLPTYRSLRIPEYPIDNIGIQPDVYLDKTISDWIAYAVGYVEN